MTAPMYLVEAGELEGLSVGSTYRLDGTEGHHAMTVRRAKPGERIDLADGEGRSVNCVVAGVERSALLLQVEAVAQTPAPRPAFVLVQALAKGGRDELAIEVATELGVDRIVPWQARHSVVVWSGERGRRAHTKWENVVRAAAKQSRRVRIPQVSAVCSTDRLVQEVQAAAAGNDVVLLLDGDAVTPLATLELAAGTAQVWLIVGPEGGISPAERDDLLTAGAIAVRLGDTVLRSSTAGPAALAVLSAGRRWR